MGVHGLWRLIEPSGKPVPLETLENKVLAVDISIWLHQAVKGFQDSKGGALPNAHLLGIFHRVCKLLYFRIKPVFVFDGGVPVLKKQTIAKRNQLKSKNVSEANRIQKQLINTLLKHNAVNKVIVENVKTNLENVKKSTNMFELPPSQFEASSSDSENEMETSVDTTESSSPTKTWDLHTIDEKSSHFKNLPADVRHEILTELKETRKQNSWGRIHELPTQSDDFSGYQMKRLLKRYSIQVSLEDAEKEMGGASLSLGELENLLEDHGVINKEDVGSRIASDENKRYFYIKSVKKAMETAKDIEKNNSDDNKMIVEGDEDLEKAIQLSLQDVPSTSKSNLENETQLPIEEQKDKNKTIGEMEYEQDLEKAIQLSLQDGASTSESSFNTYIDNDLFISDSDDGSSISDSETNAENSNKLLTSAKNYMMEYSGLTPSEISRIISGDGSKKPKNSNHKHPVEVANKQEIDKFDDFKKPQLSKLLKSKQTDLPKVISNDSKDVKETDEEVQEISDGESNDFVEVNEKTDEKLISDSTIKEAGIEIIDQESMEQIDVISDNSDSDSEFLEVESKDEENRNAFEIMIQKDAKMDDSHDIFSDIFSEAKQMEISSTIKQISIEDKTMLCNQKENRSIVPIESQSSNEKTDRNVNEITGKDSSNTNTNDKLLNEVLTSANVENAKQLSAAELRNIETQLNTEKNELLAKQSLKERLATNITEQMCTEAQDLLRLFGVPYIIAPMEAEAQCAFLDEINLTDGTITDDSDIWLFGGKTVYKNFFNQSKRVLEYRAENIQHSFKLSRYEMILLALLVGSDYTTGVQGIGPVTALEVLAHFPIKKQNNSSIQSHNQIISGLFEFKRWLRGEYNLKGRAGLRNKLKNVVLNDQFPSFHVANAYLEPSVETSDENFSWGKPDMVSLIDYAKEKFGWNQKKSEEILKPVFRSLEKTNVQIKITDYFKTTHKIQGTQIDEKMSKRVKTAIDKIGKSSTSSDEDTSKNKDNKKKKIRKPQKAKPDTSQPSTTQKDPDSAPLDDDLKLLQQTKKVSRKRAKQIENELRYEMEQKELAANKKVENPVVAFKRKLHSKEVIPQKQKDKTDMLRTKMKAIETFRKSKQGPGYVKKRSKRSNLPKDDACLSEDSD